MKKIYLFIIIFSIILFSGCTKEEKFGIDEFTKRMNKNFDESYIVEDFQLGKTKSNENIFIKENKNSLICLYLRDDNTIKCVSYLITKKADITYGINKFTNLCCVLTGNDLEKQRGILNNCKIDESNINFSNNNYVNTVDKYKYTVICNNETITLFCERI